MAYLRYQTVRNVGLGVLGVGAIAGIIVATTGGKEPQGGTASPQHVAATTRAPEPAPTRAPAPTPTRAPAPEPVADPLTKVAEAMLAPAQGEKVKDLFNGSGPKVNLYDDDKDGKWDRAKVDYERDEVDDEKLTLKDGVLEKKTEKTGATELWQGGKWVAAAAPVPASDPNADALGKVAAAMLAPAKGDKVKDLFNGSGPKVNLYDDNKDGKWDRAKVDYNRDEKDDEKLTLKDGVLEMKTEATGTVRLWKDGAWIEKPAKP